MFKVLVIAIFSLFLLNITPALALETDVIKTSGGDLTITFIGHGTLMFKYGDKIIHVDPWTKLNDYSGLPKADLILVTHEHQDHLDPAAIEKLKTDKTIIILNGAAAEKLKYGTVLANGQTTTALGFKIEAVPAYNLVHKRDNGQPYHPKGVGNGYIITFGDQLVYVAGDTENTPEMKALKGIAVAFLPMNLPFTMTPEMVADAAAGFKPKILYPYHTGETDLTKLAPLLKDSPGVEIRIRPMK